MAASGVERLDGAVGDVARERAVLRRVRRRHRIRDPVAGPVPFVLVDLGDRDFVTAGQIADDQIRARVLPLLARRGRCRRGSGCRRRRAASSRRGPAAASRTAASSAAAPGPAAAETLVIREPGRRPFREAEAADLVEGFHLAVSERHDAEPGPRGARRRTASAARGWCFGGGRFGAGGVRRRFLLFVGLRLRDREDEEPGVRRKRGRGAARVLEFLAAAEVPDDELAVLALRGRGVRQPLSVVRQPRSLDRFPVVHDVVAEGPFRAGGRLRRQRPLEREQRAEKSEHRSGVQPQTHEILLKAKPGKRVARHSTPAVKAPRGRISSAPPAADRWGWPGWCGRSP